MLLLFKLRDTWTHGTLHIRTVENPRRGQAQLTYLRSYSGDAKNVYIYIYIYIYI